METIPWIDGAYWTGAAKSAEERVLLGHILDKYDQCRQRNLPTNTAFLSPAEAQGARALLRAAAIHEGFALLGGYEGAERRMLFFLPDWQEEADASDAMAFLRAAWHESEHPTHRDLLGSLMALGVERETLGDILVSEGSADLIVSAGVAQYLLDNWTGAGRTALRLTAIGADALRVPEQKVKEIRDTVATLRLDAVTAAGFSVSRGKAAELIAAEDPMAMAFAFGFYLKRKKLGYSIYGVMLFAYLVGVCINVSQEMGGNPRIDEMGIAQDNGAMEGKEIRLGSAATALWSITTTVTSNGFVKWYALFNNALRM